MLVIYDLLTQRTQCTKHYYVIPTSVCLLSSGALGVRKQKMLPLRCQMMVLNYEIMKHTLITCEVCNGEGFYAVDFPDPNSRYGHGEYYVNCETCSGNGSKLIDELPENWANHIITQLVS